ncbi:MAG: hypothetical protein WAX89_06990 [Alphaproteobacteria bacterium]
MAKTTKPAAKKSSKTTISSTAHTSEGAEMDKLRADLDALEERIEALEEHDLARKAEEAYSTASSTLKEKYLENPTATVAVGVAILLFILLIL